MLALRRLLVAFCVVLSGVAYALTPGERVVLFSGIKPVWTANFLSPSLVASQTLPAGLTYTKSGSIPATLFDSTGKLTYQGNNLVLYSTPTTTGWGTNNGAVVDYNSTDYPSPVGAATVAKMTGGSTPFLSQSATVPLSNVIYSFYAHAGAGSSIRCNVYDGADHYVNINLTNGATSSATNVLASGAISAGGGWYRVYIVYAGLSTTPQLRLLSYDSGSVYFSGVQFEAVTYQTTPSAYNATTSSIYLAPRLDTNPATLSPAGLLVEEQRVQLVAYSNMQATGTYWDVSTNGVTPSLASVTSPDGTSDGNKITPSTNNEAHYFYTKTSYSAGTAYTFSFYAKAAGYRWLRVGGYGLVQSFDVQNGVLGVSSGSPTSTITSVGNGWYRVTMSGTSGGANTNIFVSINNIDSTTTQSFAGDGTSSIYFYGFQLEANSFPTSYIPNPTSSTVTRTADVVTPGAPITTVVNSSNGTVITEFGSVQQAGSSNPVILGSNLSFVQAISSAKKYGLDSFRASGASYDTNVLTLANANRGGVAWGPASYSIADNGNTVVTGSGSTAYSGTLYLGAYNNVSGGAINGYIRSMAVYNQRLPNPTLQQKSVVNAPY